MATYRNVQPKKFDDCITDASVWRSIEEFIPRDKAIWCPFYFNGNHTLRELDYEIIHEDRDFFTYTPEYDIIVDNPPFSIKKNILMKLKEIDKPFILIMPVSTICYNYFKAFKDIQIIVPSKRINFAPELGSSASFDTLFYCYKMNLPKDIIFLDPPLSDSS